MRKMIMGAALAVVALGGMAVATAPDLKRLRPSLEPVAKSEVERTNQQSGLHNCFWVGTVSPSTLNILFPDSGALYWASQVRLPTGSRLELEGRFPHARHISFNAYVDGVPVDRLNDLMIPPLPGSSNPFLPGAARDVAQRDYRVGVVEAAASPDQSSRAPGTLYVPQGETLHQLFYRVYVPDQGLDIQGGVALPEPVLTLADGRQVRGDELCRTVVVRDGAINDVRVSADTLREMLQVPGASSPYHPAQPVPVWNAFFNAPLAATTLLIGTPYEALRSFMDSTRRGGFFSTLDNTYMSSYIDNRFGEVLVLHAKAPSTPHTHAGQATMQPAQLRYWSLCKYRSLSDTAVDGCLYDEQVPTDAAGDYTIVVSTAANRPDNASRACGVAWLDWGTLGDGIGNPHGGFLVFRHMMPSADFDRSLFATQKPGQEQQVLGEYYPQSAYQSKADFEARGCRS